MMAIRMGATGIGLVGPMPSGPGIIAMDKITQIARALPPHIDSFLLSSETTPEALVEQTRKSFCNTLQIVDELQGSYDELKAALPGIKLVQVIHVEDESAIDRARVLAVKVDALLLDSGQPSAATKILGGTGRTHNWDISREIVRSVKIPVYLAGGLRPENVIRAIERVGSAGLDLCSGVRTNGRLDFLKLGSFMESVQQRMEQ